LSSYSFAWLDQVDPVTRKVTRIGNLNEKHGMERIQHLVVGSDEMIYGPTRPAKGYLDGGIVKVNPKSLDFEVVVPIIKGLAPTSLVLIEETGEFFGTTTTQGGTSAIATEKDARVFIWDPKTSKVVWSDPVIPGVKGWIWAARGSNGLIYGVGDFKYFAINPFTRKVVHTGELPINKGSAVRLARRPAGPKKMIYALVEGTLIGIDPTDHQARVVASHPSIMNPFHERLHGTLAICATRDGNLYYGSGADLWKVTITEESK
jgi:hypothetical protein